MATATAVASFPWFRIRLGFMETSIMHVMIVGTCIAYMFRGIQVISKSWLMIAVLFLAFTVVNILPNAGDDLIVGISLRLVIKLCLCVVGAIGCVALAGASIEFVERFFRHMTNVVFLIGVWLFYNSFFVLGDQFINVSPGFEAGSDVNRNLSAFTFALSSVTAYSQTLHNPTIGGGLKSFGLLVLAVLSGSRGAVAAGLVGIAACSLIEFKNKRAVLFVIVLIATTYSLRGYIPTTIQGRFLTLFESGNTESFSGRDDLFEVAFLKALPESPIIGHGTGTALDVVGSKIASGRRSDAHSDFNLLAIEGGVVGLAFYSSLLLIAATASIKTFLQLSPGPSRDTLALCMSVGAAAVAHGFFETQIDFIQIWMIHGFTLGLALTLARPRIKFPLARRPGMTR